MQKIYDISLPVTKDSVVWPGDPEVTIRQMSSIAQGDPYNVSQIRMSVHTGTHIDAPLHFLKEGRSIGEIPLDKLIGQVLVMDLGEDVDVISSAVLADHPQIDTLQIVPKVLFKTRNSRIWEAEGNKFNPDYVALDSSGAKFLSQLDLDLIGVDYLSVAAYNDETLPHQMLLERETVLLEGINLAQVPAGTYTLYCLPVNLAECEGAPARAVLIAE
jgi:arylformamidase